MCIRDRHGSKKITRSSRLRFCVGLTWRLSKNKIVIKPTANPRKGLLDHEELITEKSKLKLFFHGFRFSTTLRKEDNYDYHILGLTEKYPTILNTTRTDCATPVQLDD